jgi:hypothetical protein
MLTSSRFPVSVSRITRRVPHGREGFFTVIGARAMIALDPVIAIERRGEGVYLGPRRHLGEFAAHVFLWIGSLHKSRWGGNEGLMSVTME